MLRGDSAPIKNYTLKAKQFLMLLMNSEYTSVLRDMYDKKQVDLVVSGVKKISVTIYGDLEVTIP
jgi:hypothetical protein